MTVNDKEIDVLLRRYAPRVAQPAAIDHLDADELNAFAEGKLPVTARQRYVSHLADCDDCRKLASQLAVATGAATEARVPASQATAASWRQKLSVLFAPATMRYAAFAAVLVAVVGIGLIVWQRPEFRNARMITPEQSETAPAENPKQASAEGESAKEFTTSPAVPQATVPRMDDKKQLESAGANPPPPAKPADTLAGLREPAPISKSAQAEEQPRTEATPSYAPPPSNENFGYTRGRENQNISPSPGGPRRNENFEKYKEREMDRSRAAEVAKTRDENSNIVANKSGAGTGVASVMSETKDDANKRARAPSSVGVLQDGARQQSKAEDRKSGQAEGADEEAQTRSVGGRKFNRQGNAWVDAKFKTSMSVRTVSRGSEEFQKLDSGLRSIANQLGGEIVVVWKGKAYRIR